MNLAFILLAEPHLPDARDIAKAFPEFSVPTEFLQIDEGNVEDATSRQILSLKLSTGESAFVALMPIAVPNGEADEGARFSLSALSEGWTLPPHHAHLVVTFSGGDNSPPLVKLSRFTSLLAAVAKASKAVGIYWGGAGATHDAAFFQSLATDQGVMPRIILWTGVSMAREADGRLSLLSLGMKQLELPDMLLVAGQSSAGEAIQMMFNCLAYVAERGQALPEGDTIGGSNEERLRVSYVPSPVDAAVRVWRVEMP